MLAGERKVAEDGYEVFLFPCEGMFLNIGRGEHDVLALDFLPVNINGAPITAMPLYAPFTGTIVYTGNDHNCILESNNKVHTPLGLKYARVLVAHSESAPSPVGSEFRQGFLYYRTGNYGYSFGEHLHMEIALVDSKSTPYWNSGGIGLRGAVHMWEGLYVDDTRIYQSGNKNWLYYGETPEPEPEEEKRKKKKFPWAVYTKHMRLTKHSKNINI